MEPKEKLSEQQTKSTGGAAIPMPWNSNTNIDDNHNNTNTTTSPTPSTTNEDKNNDGNGVGDKAPKKRGRPSSKKSAPLTEEMSSPPQKKPLKPPTEVKKEVEEEKHTIFQSPSFNHYNNYAGYAFTHPHAYYGLWPSNNSWASNSIENQSNDKNGPMSSGSGEISTAGPEVPLLTPIQKMPITPKQIFIYCIQFGTPHPMFYPTQQNEVQTIIIKDIKEEISEDAKDGISIYRNCLVCGDNNKKCGKYTALQVCDSCKQFFKRVVESDADKKATFQCSQRSENCLISKATRNSCEFCRFQACLKSGMDRQKTVELKAKREPEDAKDGNGIYRNCLVCGDGDNNYKCGKCTGTGLQVCDACRQFFKRVVKSGSDKKDTFQCSQGPGNCLISKQTRNSCEFCRFQACLKAGMDRQKRVEIKVKREKQKGSGNDN